MFVRERRENGFMIFARSAFSRVCCDRVGFLPCFFLVFLVFLVSACSTDSVQITLTDRTGVQSDFTYLLYDSAGICDRGVVRFPVYGGQVRFSFDVREQSFVHLLSASPPWELLLLVSPGESIEVESHRERRVVHGSEESARLLALDEGLEAFRRRCKGLETLYSLAYLDSVPDARRGAILRMHARALDSMRDALRDFIVVRPYSKAALLALLAEYDSGQPFFPIHEYDSLFRYVQSKHEEVYASYFHLEPIGVALARLGREFLSDSLRGGLRIVGDSVPFSLEVFPSVESAELSAFVGTLLWVGVQMRGSEEVALLDSALRGFAGLPVRWVRFMASDGEVVSMEVSAGGVWDSFPLDGVNDALRKACAWLGLEVCPRSYVIDARGRIVLVDPSARDLRQMLRPYLPYWARPRRVMSSVEAAHGGAE